jgi:glycosyltransferase involved in cell wall biosynthesis
VAVPDWQGGFRLDRVAREVAESAERSAETGDGRHLRVTIVASPWRGGAGAERVVSELTRFLSSRHEVTTVCPPAGSRTRDPGFSYTGPVLNVRLDHGRWGFIPKPVSVLINAARLGGAIRATRPDVVLSSYSITLHSLTAMAKALGWIDSPLVIRFGSPPSFQMADRSRSSMVIFRRLVGHADALIANSSGVAADINQYLHVTPSMIRVIPNPCDVAGVQRLAEAAREGAPLVNARTIVSLGRLAQEKNHALMIRSFARIAASADARLVIAGDGPLRSDLERLGRELGVADRVVFLGWLSNPFPLLREAGAFCLSSEYEGFGYALIEAMACGCPVIATDAPYGPKDILEEGSYGLLVPNGDEQALATGMLRILSDPGLQADLRRRGRERAALYDLARIGETYATVLQEAVVRHKARASR